MTDAMLIRRGEEFTMLDARYDRRGVEEELSLGMAKGRRKSLKRMGKEYQRLSTHIGAFPLVLSSPHDIDLIRGTGEERRRLIDMLISQATPYISTGSYATTAPSSSATRCCATA